MKRFSMLALAAATSVALFAAPAMADCDDEELVGTGVGAVIGGGLAAAINNGNDTGAAIGGAIIGGFLGNRVASDRCDDDRYDAYYYERGSYDAAYRGRPYRWNNRHTGAHGEFRVIRTYDDYGYWRDDRWYPVDYADYRRDSRRYDEVTCRDYVEIYDGPRGSWERDVTVCSDGDRWRRVD